MATQFSSGFPLKQFDRARALIYKLAFYIGPIGEISRKHRRAMMFTSVLMLFLDPRVSITVGSLSAGGVGVAVEPSQTISVAFGLFLALGYLTLAFWFSVLIESGTDEPRAQSIAAFRVDPSFGEDQEPRDMDELVRSEARNRISKWSAFRVGWEVLLPSVLAIIALSRFLYAGIHNT